MVMALRLGCMMLITFRNSKERGFDPHPCQHVFALVQVVFLFAIAFSRVASHLGTVGQRQLVVGQRPTRSSSPSFYPALNQRFVISLNQG